MLNFTPVVYSLMHIMPNQMASDFLIITTISYLVEIPCVLLGSANCIISAKKLQRGLWGFSAPVVHKTNLKNYFWGLMTSLATFLYECNYVYIALWEITARSWSAIEISVFGVLFRKCMRAKKVLDFPRIIQEQFGCNSVQCPLTWPCWSRELGPDGSLVPSNLVHPVILGFSKFSFW